MRRRHSTLANFASYLVLVAIFAASGATVAFFWPLIRYSTNDHRHQNDRLRDNVMTDNKDRATTRCILGACIGVGIVGGYIVKYEFNKRGRDERA